MNPFDVQMVIDPASKTLVSESTKLLYAKFATKISELSEARKFKIDSYEELAVQFNDYFVKSYIKYNSMPTIALRDKKVTLKEMYLPLNLTESAEKNAKVFPMKEFDTSFFSEYPKILINDKAGMGKSTLSQFLFLSAIEQRMEIPVFIELRGLKNGKTLLDEIYNKFNYFGEEFKKEYLIDLIKKGDFIFFFDGFDEIANNELERVNKEIKDFIANSGNNKFIITSRPISSANFPDFNKFEIKGLENEQAFNLIKKFDGITKLNLHNSLVNSIKESGNNYREFLENPLYVSLLYLTYKRKKELPVNQSEFYKQVYEALYFEHDLTKDGSYKRVKDSGLSLDELSRFLGRFAFVCLLKNLNDFNYQQLINLISDTVNKSNFNKDIEPRTLFKDLTENVPLFVRVGNDYKWIHKSFMEYFSSIHISLNENKTEILNHIKNSKEIENYENMLNIYADIDKDNFDKVFISPFLSHYIKYTENVLNDFILQDLDRAIFGQKFFFTRLPKEYIKKYEKKDADIPISDSSHKIFLSIHQYLMNLDVGFGNFSYALMNKVGESKLYCNCHIDPYINLIKKISINKSYKFWRKSSIRRNVNINKVIEENPNIYKMFNELNIEKDKFLIINYQDSDRKMINTLIRLGIDSHDLSKVIDEKIAAEYLTKIKEKEENISDVLSLLI
ncbi:NACHT domain-containing protein [Rossellomorea aquimaris]|uniref:Short NACHT-associated C-terminal domain-containing protein n=1 Tax=Rossellomorea aquimaris TaxID=189382 RepID=A0A1J6WSY1_9BACI|nr:hypothetical protein [Rossellomorea aquimaris]OIU71023.1 hypothetical protein BHE18_08215 [Rossellomorea aquimaris]